MQIAEFAQPIQPLDEIPTQPLGELYIQPAYEIPTQPLGQRPSNSRPIPGKLRQLGQILRFGIVGAVNTIVDLLLLNGLLWLLPTHDARWLLVYNSVTYALGAVNSFILNKYWTFRDQQKTSWREIWRFAATTLFGLCCNDAIIWLASNFIHPLAMNATLWANASKVLAIFGTACISYLGMHLWVFVRQPQEKQPARAR